MQPTAVALDLIEQTRPMLQGIQRVLSPRYVFDPAQFADGCSASPRLISCSPCLRICCRGCGARRRAFPPNGPRRASRPCWTLRRGRSMWRSCPPNCACPKASPAKPWARSGGDAFGRKDHPAFGKWSRRTWTQWPHLVVRVGDSLTSPVNVAASAAGLDRTIAGWVPHFSAIAPVLGELGLACDVAGRRDGRDHARL